MLILKPKDGDLPRVTIRHFGNYTPGSIIEISHECACGETHLSHWEIAEPRDEEKSN